MAIILGVSKVEGGGGAHKPLKITQNPEKTAKHTLFEIMWWAPPPPPLLLTPMNTISFYGAHRLRDLPEKKENKFETVVERILRLREQQNLGPTNVGASNSTKESPARRIDKVD